MGLLLRMSIAIALIFGLLFAFVMMIAFYLEYLGYVGGIWVLILPLALACIVVTLQWGISPYFIKWVYKIVWINPDEGFLDPRYEKMYRSVVEMARDSNVKVPLVGIVPDDNPNAFAFGWTRNKAHLVLTNGVFRYCDDDEVETVAAHELGHIVHNDFVVMTVITAIVLTFYIVARWAFRIGRMAGRSRNGGAIGGAIAGIGAISFLMYLIANFISLLVSRYREYWADRYSAETTKKPNKLSSALVKIAYGLATEGRGLDVDDRRNQDAHHSNALMFFSAHSARGLAVQSTTASGTIEKEAIKDTMSWDLWNPWGFFYELNMTHPLPAKRILALNKLAEEQGQMPYLVFDKVKPESYWDDFLGDIMAKWSFIWGFVIAMFMVFFGYEDIFLMLGLTLAWAGLFGFIYFRFYRHPLTFRDARVKDLLGNPKASPVRGIPVKLRGIVIGRGIPGLFFSEDLKIDDGTGLLLIDYKSIARLIDFFQGAFRTQRWVGTEVVIEGWYRRPVVPMLELLRMEGGGMERKVWRPYIKMGIALFLMVIGLLLLAVSFA